LESALPLLRFEGAVTIQAVADAKARLSEALAAGGDLSVDCSAVDDVDVTFLQVLIATHRSAALRGFGFRLDPPPSLPFFTMLDRAGVTLPSGLIPPSL
jgi:anti-anti-sigma regulatory factor